MQLLFGLHPRNKSMPNISEFYGIKIYMYWNDYEQHSTPQIHANYAEFQAVMDFNGNILAGFLPLTAKKLVKKWILKNQTMLVYSWKLAIKNLPFPKIEGLK